MSDRSQHVLSLVEVAMNNATENGYAEELSKLDDAELASDLQGCDADLEGEYIADILAAVKEFRAAKAA